MSESHPPSAQSGGPTQTTTPSTQPTPDQKTTPAPDADPCADKTPDPAVPPPPCPDPLPPPKPGPCPPVVVGPTPDPYTPPALPECPKPAPCPPPCPDVAPGDQLKDLKKRLEADKAEAEEKAQRVDKLKVTIADLTQRVAGLEKTVADLPNAAKDYTAWYENAERDKRCAESNAASIRSHLKLTAEQKKCVEDATHEGEQQVKLKEHALKCQKDVVAQLEEKWKTAAADLEASKTRYEFFKAGLRDGFKAKLGKIGELKKLADDAKTDCLKYFYVNEMDALLKNDLDPKGEHPEVCYPPSDIQIGTLLCCWAPANYEKAYNWALVRFNNAEYMEKCLKADLEAEKKKVPDLEKAAKEAPDKRRDWTVAAIERKACCPKPAATA